MTVLPTAPPLVVHLLYRLDFGGLETVLAECVNGIPAERYRHAIVCLTDYTEFSQKITQAGVQIFSLHKKPGPALGVHLQLWKLLRHLQPAILHTYNLSAIEYTFTAALAGVPIRIHAEHGRDLSDPQGLNRKHNLLRRLLTPFIDCYIPVSRDLQQWLTKVIQVPDAKNRLINNGVDTKRFQPHRPATTEIASSAPQFIVGTVGRIQDIKNHRGLIRAFERMRALLPAQRASMRLHIIGDGPLMPDLRAQVAAAGLVDQVWLPGARTDIAELMQGFSVFALPSFAEGTPVTLLEAMASGLAVVASPVGGIPDVVVDGRSGTLAPADDIESIATALAAYCTHPDMCAEHGAAGRTIVEDKYSVAAMLTEYMDLYDTLCQRKRTANSPSPP